LVLNHRRSKVPLFLTAMYKKGVSKKDFML